MTTIGLCDTFGPLFVTAITQVASIVAESNWPRLLTSASSTSGSTSVGSTAVLFVRSVSTDGVETVAVLTTLGNGVRQHVDHEVVRRRRTDVEGAGVHAGHVLPRLRCRSSRRRCRTRSAAPAGAWSVTVCGPGSDVGPALVTVSV